jgi:DnaJ-class molecular chaperone
MKTTSVGKRINPEKYGMIFCPSCNGSGKSLSEATGVKVCKVCRGFGAIKREDKDVFNDNRVPVKLEFITE